MVYRSGPQDADERIRSARAAILGRERARGRRKQLLDEIDDADRRVMVQQSVVVKEHGDVDRVQRGTLGFLVRMFGDPERRLEKERAEADLAEAALGELTSWRAGLQRELGEIDERIARFRTADIELEEALAAKQAELVTRGDRVSVVFRRILDELATLAAEIVQLKEAQRAGDELTRTLNQLVEILETGLGTATKFPISDDRDQELYRSAWIAGATQARISAFTRELADVGIEFSPSLRGASFLETWFHTVQLHDDLVSGLQRAHALGGATLESVITVIARLAHREFEAEARVVRLEAERAQLLEPP